MTQTVTSLARTVMAGSPLGHCRSGRADPSVDATLLGGLKALKRLGPAVLPMQGKPGEDRDGRKYPSSAPSADGAIHPPQRPTGDASCR